MARMLVHKMYCCVVTGGWPQQLLRGSMVRMLLTCGKVRKQNIAAASVRLTRPGTPALGCGATKILRAAVLHNAIRPSSGHAVSRDQNDRQSPYNAARHAHKESAWLVESRCKVSLAEILSEVVQSYALQPRRTNCAPCPSMLHPVAGHARQRWHSARLPARARHQRALTSVPMHRVRHRAALAQLQRAPARSRRCRRRQA